MVKFVCDHLLVFQLLDCLVLQWNDPFIHFLVKRRQLVELNYTS